jgi:hypothetical protein
VQESNVFETSGGSPPVDLQFENHFSLFLIRPISPAGQTFLDENVGDESTLIFGGAVVCEPRYVESILHGWCADENFTRPTRSRYNSD